MKREESEKPVSEKPADSFPILTDDDRQLLNNVLRSAQAAIDTAKKTSETEAKARINLEGRVLAVEGDIQELERAVQEFRGVSGDIRGLRGDISALNSNVMANLQADAERERRFGALKLEVERLANDSGRAGGKSAGARWGAISGLIAPALIVVLWLVSTLVALATGKAPPPFPLLPSGPN